MPQNINNDMKISVVTPCYNMEKYIEGTIISVLSQNYDNLEYIIVDGGSTDGSMEIINKYRDKIAVVISEPDHGMYDAIAKGFAVATGDIFAYINADDTYFPHTFRLVNEIFTANSEIDWIGGRPAYINENRNLTDIFPQVGAKRSKDIARGYFHQNAYGFLMQESMFWRKELYIKSGGINGSLRLAGDFDLWRRFAQFAEFIPVDVPLAAFMRRNESISKTQKERYLTEIASLYDNALPYPDFLWKLISRNKKFIVLRRLITYRKGIMLQYSVKRKSFVKISIFNNVSYHTFKSAIRYFKV